MYVHWQCPLQTQQGHSNFSTCDQAMEEYMSSIMKKSEWSICVELNCCVVLWTSLIEWGYIWGCCCAVDLLGGSISGSRLSCGLSPIRVESWPIQILGIIPKCTESCVMQGTWISWNLHEVMKPDYYSLGVLVTAKLQCFPSSFSSNLVSFRATSHQKLILQWIFSSLVTASSVAAGGGMWSCFLVSRKGKQRFEASGNSSSRHHGLWKRL